MERTVDVKIIGLGGIGSVVCESVSRFLNFVKGLDKYPMITLIDGDKFETKNHERQNFIVEGENKSETKKKELKEKFKGVIFASVPEFITDGNVSRFIEEKDIVMLCVDNHKTRKVVSDYCSKLNTITLISGGNELEDGNVQIFVKNGGEKVTPSLTDYHPEIDNPQDKSPEEKSCQELQQSEPQLYFTNLMVSCYMCCALYNTMNENHQYSEVYFDITTMKADSKIRKIKEVKKVS
jgi:molybdopterin/thiamine biosynthesis adenylyltransferase